MKHAKRMVLAPEDVLNRYEQKQKIETSPITSHMMHQDTAIKLKWTVKRFLIRIYRIWSVMPCVHVRILIPRERRNSFAGCQRLMYPKVFARNTERWDQVQMGSPSGAEEAVFKTPPPRLPPLTSPRASPAKYLRGLLIRQAAKPKQWLPY
jgi:hypothetical protein